MAVDNGNCSGLVEYLVKYSVQEISQCKNELKQVDEVLQELAEIREIIGIDSVEWVPDNEHLEQSKAMAQMIKETMLENSVMFKCWILPFIIFMVNQRKYVHVTGF